LALAASPAIAATLIVWLFVMRALMIVTSLASYFVNEALSKAMFGRKKHFDFEATLTHLVWITSGVSIGITFLASKFLLGDFKDAGGVAQPALWWVLSCIISCGTVAGALIPEFTKVFVSTNSKHVREVTNCSKHGGASLNILSGFVAGNFSAFWMGLVLMVLMFTSYYFSQQGSLLALMPAKFLFAAPIFAFGLVAFGIIMLLQRMYELNPTGGVFKPVVDALSIVQPEIILGLIMGGSVIYWFTGASCQAVVTGAYRAVVYIKENMNLEAKTASDKDSKEVVRICTQYAQKGMWNIFIVIFCFALALP